MSHGQILSRHDVGTNRKETDHDCQTRSLRRGPCTDEELAPARRLAIASSLEPSLAELVKIRASQINGCANCINMHAAEAREKGETEQRIYLLSAWREAPCYTDRERAALGWTEALTRLSEGHAHASAYEALKAQFTEEEQVKLTLMINVINGWNRIAVGFGVWARSGGRQVRCQGGRRLMTNARPEDAAASFEPLRPKLMRVAYRMLGSVADAEDMVQEAFIRWMKADRSEVREPEAFLRRTVTRLCLDQLKSARHQRETYVGPWLPDPVVEEERRGRRHLAADACAGTPFSARAGGFLAARCVRAGIRGGRGRPSSATRRPAASSLPARAPMSARRDLVSRSKSNVASRSPRPSSPPRAAAT